MPSQQPYNLVKDDQQDSKAPIYPDEAFFKGITFNVKVRWKLNFQNLMGWNESSIVYIFSAYWLPGGFETFQ